MIPTFTCECSAPHWLYRVTDHDDSTEIVAYCDECADLASVDWNGATKSIEPITERTGVHMAASPEIRFTETHSTDGVRRWVVRVWDDQANAWRETAPMTYSERLEYVRHLRAGAEVAQ